MGRLQGRPLRRGTCIDRLRPQLRAGAACQQRAGAGCRRSRKPAQGGRGARRRDLRHLDPAAAQAVDRLYPLCAFHRWRQVLRRTADGACQPRQDRPPLRRHRGGQCRARLRQLDRQARRGCRRGAQAAVRRRRGLLRGLGRSRQDLPGRLQGRRPVVRMLPHRAVAHARRQDAGAVAPCIPAQRARPRAGAAGHRRQGHAGAARHLRRLAHRCLSAPRPRRFGGARWHGAHDLVQRARRQAHGLGGALEGWQAAGTAPAG